MGLEDVLSEDKPEVTETPAPETPAPEAPAEPVETSTSTRKAWQEREQEARQEGEGKVRDPETGKFVKQEAKEEPKEVVKEEKKEQPREEMSQKERALLAAAQDERNKRQDLERRLKELEAKPQGDPKTFWDAPEEHLQKFQQDVQGMITRTRLDTSESIARQRYKDFDQNVQVFAEVIRQTPGMQQQWLNSPDPAEFAYRTGKNYRELQEVGNLDALRTKIEQETRKKIEEEYKKKAEDRKNQASNLPGSLSDVHGGNPTKPVWNGPSSLDDILA